MKNSYALSESDIEAIKVALTVLPSYGFVTPDVADATFAAVASAATKLIMHEPLLYRESFIIALSVDSAYKALRSELDLDEEKLAELRPYFFTYNKLLPILAPFLEE